MKGFFTRALEPHLRLPAAPPTLPTGPGETVRVFRASDGFLSYRMLGAVAGTVVGILSMLVGLVATAAAGEWVAFAIVTAVLVVVTVQLLLSIVVTRLDWDLRYYVVSDSALRIREGAWILRELTLTFLNVQNVTIEQGPIERLFKIANVVVLTAGGGGSGASSQGASASGHRAVIRGVTNANEIRDLIRARLEAARRDAGLGDFEDEESEVGTRGRHVLASHLALLQEIREETMKLAQVSGGRRSP